MIVNICYKVLYGTENNFDAKTLNECGCGYLYFIGNCGKPNFERLCPACNQQIGGLSHNFATNNKNIPLSEFIKTYSDLELSTGNIYTVRDTDNLDASITHRAIQEGKAFSFIELLVHARYLLDLFIR